MKVNIKPINLILKLKSKVQIEEKKTENKYIINVVINKHNINKRYLRLDQPKQEQS